MPVSARTMTTTALRTIAFAMVVSLFAVAITPRPPATAKPATLKVTVKGPNKITPGEKATFRINTSKPRVRLTTRLMTQLAPGFIEPNAGEDVGRVRTNRRGKAKHTFVVPREWGGCCTWEDGDKVALRACAVAGGRCGQKLVTVRQ